MREPSVHQSRHEQRRLLDLVHQRRVLELIAAGAPHGAIGDALCQSIEALVPGSACGIVILEGDGPGRHAAHGPHLPPSLLLGLAPWAERASLDPAPGTRPVQPENASAAAQAAGFAAESSLPVMDLTTGTPRGAIRLFHRESRTLDADQQEALEAVAWLASLALLGPSLATLDDAGGFRQLVEGLPAITYVQQVTDATTTLYVSPRVETLLGWTPAEYTAGDRDWFRAVHPDDRECLRSAVSHALATGQPLDIAYRVLTRDGQVVWLRDKAALSGDSPPGVQVWRGVQFDISREKQAEHQLHRLAYYDSLTGLPNRRLCMDRLQALLSQPDRPAIALLFLDLDRFKFINDGIGHVAGDELLAAVAQRLAAHIDGQGALARFGGDEFVAVMEHVALQEVEGMADTLLSALREPFHVNGYELHVEGTIGIAVASPDLSTPEALLHAADMALYRAKADGRGVYKVYDAALDQRGPDRLLHEAELRRALEQGEFQIAYQPVVDIVTRRILAIEALVRWEHPDRGLLEPSAFIPIADETGLVVPLGTWVIEEACRQMRHWQTRYATMRSVQISVNLSGRQFRQATLVDDVALVLRQSGLAPRSLALEIKEGDALADAAAVSLAVRGFKRLGVKVTIDDFGKGLAALGSLTQFTVDDLKIDGSCVSRLGQGQQDIDVVRALVGMAKAMGLDVTAGAVETGEQLAMLRDMGCDRAQGHHLVPPLPAEELERLFQLDAANGEGPGT